MKFLIQRVNNASVSVDSKVIGKINKGLLVFVGVFEEDSYEICDKLIKKLLGLRIFSDNEGKTNLSLKDVNGELLIISQFTLCADCKKGNRPSFINAAKPAKAIEMYEYIIKKCKEDVKIVNSGKFGADMQVDLCNDGPFTIVLDSFDICGSKKM